MQHSSITYYHGAYYTTVHWSQYQHQHYKSECRPTSDNPQAPSQRQGQGIPGMCGKQNRHESPQQFPYCMIRLKKKILFQLNQASTDIQYEPKTIQEVFLHSIYHSLESKDIDSNWDCSFQMARSLIREFSAKLWRWSVTKMYTNLNLVRSPTRQQHMHIVFRQREDTGPLTRGLMRLNSLMHR